MFLKGLLGQLSMEITSLNHNTRHGTLLAVAEIMETLHQKGSNSGRNITDELMEMSAILLEQVLILLVITVLYLFSLGYISWRNWSLRALYIMVTIVAF
jgi:hypothetical protein